MYLTPSEIAEHNRKERAQRPATCTCDKRWWQVENTYLIPHRTPSNHLSGCPHRTPPASCGTKLTFEGLTFQCTNRTHGGVGTHTYTHKKFSISWRAPRGSTTEA